jgi:hypothetical protein
MAKNPPKKKVARRSTPKATSDAKIAKRAARDPLGRTSAAKSIDQSFEEGSSTTLLQFRNKINWS